MLLLLVGSLSPDMQSKVEKSAISKCFKFGSGKRYNSLGLWKIPLNIAGKDVMLETDLGKVELPCLISRAALKRAQCTLLLETDEAIIYGKKVNLDLTNSGHYALPIRGQDQSEEVFVNITGSDKIEKAKKLVHHHKVL